MVEHTKWHVRSNGLDFIIMDQGCNIIAECRRESDAKRIVAMRELLISMNARGGLGLDVHNYIRETLNSGEVEYRCVYCLFKIHALPTSEPQTCPTCRTNGIRSLLVEGKE